MIHVHCVLDLKHDLVLHVVRVKHRPGDLGHVAVEELIVKLAHSRLSIDAPLLSAQPRVYPPFPGPDLVPFFKGIPERVHLHWKEKTKRSEEKGKTKTDGPYFMFELYLLGFS